MNYYYWGNAQEWSALDFQLSGADIRFKEDQDRFVRAVLFKIIGKTLTISFLNDIL